MPSPEFLSHNSTAIENVIEHGFLRDLSCVLLKRNAPTILDILRADVDRNGIDLVLSVGKVAHHIQMKARTNSELKKAYEISEVVWSNPSGCVIWVVYSSETMLPISYYLLGCPLPGILQFNPTKDRPKYRDVHMRNANYRKIALEELAGILFPTN